MYPEAALCDKFEYRLIIPEDENMSTSWRSTDVRCPFYVTDDQRAKRVTCEGVVEGSILATIYRNKADFQKQMEVFCCEYYQKCEIYRMLMEKYEE